LISHFRFSAVEKEHMPILKKYAALGRTAWALTLEYRAQILIWMMSSFLMVVMLLVWLSISRDGTVNGFTSADFVAYFMIGWVVRNLTAVWSSWELDYAIRQGTLSPLLLRPIHPIHNEIAANWVEKSLRVAIVLPIATVVLLLTPGANVVLTPAALLLFALAVIGAWLLCFLLDYLVGMLAFWTTQTAAFIEMTYAVRLVLSGVIAPIAMFPPAVQDVLRWLPFPYMLNFPTEILTGRYSTAEQLLFGFTVQFAWVAVLALAVTLVWKMAIRSYSAVGA
jgi:ABC-2 type transport system permease protein